MSHHGGSLFGNSFGGGGGGGSFVFGDVGGPRFVGQHGNRNTVSPNLPHGGTPTMPYMAGNLPHWTQSVPPQQVSENLSLGAGRNGEMLHDQLWEGGIVPHGNNAMMKLGEYRQSGHLPPLYKMVDGRKQAIKQMPVLGNPDFDTLLDFIDPSNPIYHATVTPDIDYDASELPLPPLDMDPQMGKGSQQVAKLTKEKAELQARLDALIAEKENNRKRKNHVVVLSAPPRKRGGGKWSHLSDTIMMSVSHVLVPMFSVDSSLLRCSPHNSPILGHEMDPTPQNS